MNPRLSRLIASMAGFLVVLLVMSGCEESWITHHDTFSGSEVTGTVDGSPIWFQSAREIRYNSTASRGSRRYEMNFDYDEMILGFPSREPGIYSGDEIAIEINLEDGFDRERFSHRNCDPPLDDYSPVYDASEVTVEYDEYGVISGSIDATVCTSALETAGVQFRGEFSGTVRD